jgi:hypothetical protein
MKKKIIKREAAVLLLVVLMVFSSVTVLANTNTRESINQTPAPTHRGLVWDNVMGIHGSRGGIIVATVRSEGIAFPADDFQFATQQTVTSVAWQGGYFICQLAQGQKDYHWDWRILFWNDIGNGSWPGTVIYNQTIPDASITRSFWYNYTRPDNGNTYWVANYSCELPVPITFTADTKYWITIQAIQTPNTYPQGAWSRHNSSQSPILLHEAMFEGAYWGYTNWVTIMSLLSASGDPDPLPHDLNFQLWFQDITPPVTTIALNGTMQGGVYITDVIATLTATDVGTGVDYTKYQVDGGAWNTYSVPFVVAGNGNHTIVYYSVDKAGNIEANKTATFTIKYPIEITIKGGFGVTATIKNKGTGPLSGVAWTITLDGKLIFVGKTKSGTVNIPAGGQAQAKDMVFGFGKTNIAVSAAGTEATTTGMVILFFVIGVK